MNGTKPMRRVDRGPRHGPLVLPVLLTIRRARAARKLAAGLCAMLVVLPIVLAVVPWQQNVPASGRVTALDPLERIQVIPAPVQGRLVRLNVREGSGVEVGDVLAVMEDLDPEFSARLAQQTAFARDKVEAAHTALETLDAQLIGLEETRAAALRSARAEFHSAVEKVVEAERKLDAEEEKAEFARLDFERQVRLWATGNTSEQRRQKADTDYKAAVAIVQGARAVVAQARLTRDGKEAAIEQVDAEMQVKIDEIKGKEQEARARLQDAKKALTDAESAEARQSTQTIVAPVAGSVQRVHAAANSNVIGRGDPLFEIVPRAGALAVEVWLRGIDAPLVQPGRRVRLQFEGWPAAQVAGWPSVAVGTFGGVVRQVDTFARADGRVRAMVVADPDDDPWPERRFLRQGVRANGWVQLDTVSSGYELWRRLNAFPPSVQRKDATTTGGEEQKNE